MRQTGEAREIREEMKARVLDLPPDEIGCWASCSAQRRVLTMRRRPRNNALGAQM
jgi:hypothetical protein